MVKPILNLLIRIIFILLFSALLFSCSRNEPRIYTISDASKKSIIVLKTRKRESFIYLLSLKVTSNIKGKATLSIANSIKFNLEHNVTKTRYTDWYTDSVELVYQPEPGTTGKLEIEYQFGY